MAADPRKHQKAKERRNKREKEKQKDRRRIQSQSPLAFLDKVEGTPFLYCRIDAYAFTGGMSNFVVARELPNGQAAVVIFLADLFCLGVKDIVLQVMQKSKLKTLVQRKIFADTGNTVRDFTPEEGLKFVKELISFAEGFGFSPAQDTAVGMKIFTGIDCSNCQTVFHFGNAEGKPRYINGPRDSVQFQRKVLDTLERTAGPDGYDYIMMGGEGLFDAEEIDWQDDELLYESDDDEGKLSDR